MIAAFDKSPISMDEFLVWYPENSDYRYELRRGVIIEMPKPRGKHSEIAGFIINALNQTIARTQAPCFIPRECILRSSEDTGYEPDVAVMDRLSLDNEPRWDKALVIECGASVKLVVEVVSTHWRDDYALKMADYESLGIGEYWIVDYLGLGGRHRVGPPRNQP